MALSMAHDLKLHTATEPLTVKESEPLSLPYSAEDMEEVEYESLPTDNLSAHLLAGGVAGMVEHCAMYPVDSIKVRRSRVMRLWSLVCVLVWCGVLIRFRNESPCFLWKRTVLFHVTRFDAVLACVFRCTKVVRFEAKSVLSPPPTPPPGKSYTCIPALCRIDNLSKLFSNQRRRKSKGGLGQSPRSQRTLRRNIILLFVNIYAKGWYGITSSAKGKVRTVPVKIR